MKQTYRLTIDVEVDAEAFSNGSLNGNPGRWNWAAIQGIVDIPGISVTIKDEFIACCEAKIEWHNEKVADTIGNVSETFLEWEHDEDCVNFKDIVDDLDDDEDSVADQLAQVFGEVTEVAGETAAL